MLNRRKRENLDYLVLIMKALALTGWLLFVIGLVVSFYAAPDDDFALLRYHEIEIRTYWLTPLTGYLYVILWLSALFSYLSITINHFRSRRKDDNQHYNYLLLFTIVVCWIIYIARDFA